MNNQDKSTDDLERFAESPAGYPLGVISYVDILGFRSIVENQTPNSVSRAIHRFQRSSDVHAESHTSMAFSDLIVRVARLDGKPDHLETYRRICVEASDIAYAQWHMMKKGYVVRGAITVGRIRADGQAVYGPGLIRAYDLEREMAKQPRVILDPAVADEFQLSSDREASDFTQSDDYFSTSEDGFVFVDYVRIACGADAEYGAQESIFLTDHRWTIQAGLRSPDPRVKAKYEWLKRYHIWAVEELGVREEIGIDWDEPGHSRRAGKAR
jgi:hypothetical protein